MTTPVIVKMKVAPSNKERVKIDLDNDESFTLHIMLAASLSKGQSLSVKTLKDLKQKDELRRSYDWALRFLGYRDRSQYEIRQYLLQKEISANAIEQTVERLTREKLIDDESFARKWIASRCRLNPKGEWALRQELRQKRIGELEIDAALMEFIEEDAAWTAVQKHQRKWQKLETEKLKKKIFTYLSQRGFSYETTLKTYERLIHIDE